MMTRYWLTSHWPPLKGKRLVAGVWIKDGKQAAGADLRPGDKLLIYETKTGPSELIRHQDGSTTRLPRERGDGRIIMIAEVDEKLHVDQTSKPKEYVGRKPIWWLWFASATPISTSGFVPREEVNRVLTKKSGRKYNLNYNFRGFGELNSGLKELDKEEFQLLVQNFRSNAGPRPIVRRALRVPPRRRRGKGGIESPAHRLLKDYVFADPTAALGEEGLTRIEKEYRFYTGDKADVVLEDQFGNIIGVEVETRVDDAELEGPLQAIKYRSMLELEKGRRRGDGRAFLVAYSISRKIRQLCADYGVECFEIDAKRVKNWRKSGEEE